jgi:hypothetical protein
MSELDKPRIANEASGGAAEAAPSLDFGITEAMIEAGSCEVSQFDPRDDDAGAAAILIYQAMERARAV